MAGLTFSETMSGNFSLNANYPQEGEEQGKQADHTLAMHATVEIDDIDRFIAQADHAGSLSGTIDFTPFGNAIPTHSGAFNLFSPAEDPDMKFMVYELGFTHEGEEYYLAGRKEVKDDPGFDLWKDTTTLFTRLHKGSSKDAPVCGAGILTLGVAELAKLVPTIRATHTQNASEAIETIAKFGTFFMGELWDSYAPSISAS